MQDISKDKVAAFDTLFTNNHIQILKVLLSYLDRPLQRYLAIYIKYLELQYTLKFFQQYPDFPFLCLPSENTMDIEKICLEITPYCNQSECQKMDQLRNMFKTFSSYREIMETVNMMKDFFPEGMNFNNMDGDFMSQIMSMMGGFGT